MSLEAVQQAYKNWIGYETEVDEELRENLQNILKNPTDDADRFFADIIYDYTDETDVFWVQQALEYSQYSSKRTTAIGYLEHMLSNHEKYVVVDSLFSMAISYLGQLATYPNKILAYLIEKDDYKEIRPRILKSIQAASYGAYIMTATNFQTGFDAGQELKGSPRQPTVKLAEQFIANWREQQGKK